MASIRSIAGRIYVGDRDVTNLREPDVSVDKKTGLYTLKLADGSVAMWSPDGLQTFAFSKNTPQSTIDFALSLRSIHRGDFVQFAS